MVRSFDLSNYKNNIWRGREYADLRYKKNKDHTGGGHGGLMVAKPDFLLRFFSLHHLWQTEVLLLSFNLNSCVCLRFRCSESGEGMDGDGKSDSNSVLPLSLLCFSLCVSSLIASLYFHLCVYRISISLSLLLSLFPRCLSLSFIASLLRSVCIWRCRRIASLSLNFNREIWFGF